MDLFYFQMQKRYLTSPVQMGRRSTRPQTMVELCTLSTSCGSMLPTPCLCLSLWNRAAVQPGSLLMSSQLVVLIVLNKNMRQTDTRRQSQEERRGRGGGRVTGLVWQDAGPRGWRRPVRARCWGILWKSSQVPTTISRQRSVLRIWIRRIRMFLGHLDPDPLVRGTDPDPSIIK